MIVKVSSKGYRTTNYNCVGSKYRILLHIMLSQKNINVCTLVWLTKMGIWNMKISFLLFLRGARPTHTNLMHTFEKKLHANATSHDPIL